MLEIYIKQHTKIKYLYVRRNALVGNITCQNSFTDNLYCKLSILNSLAGEK